MAKPLPHIQNEKVNTLKSLNEIQEPNDTITINMHRYLGNHPTITDGFLRSSTLFYIPLDVAGVFHEIKAIVRAVPSVSLGGIYHFSVVKFLSS